MTAPESTYGTEGTRVTAEDIATVRGQVGSESEVSAETLAVLDAVAILTTRRGYPPSIREVAAMTQSPVQTTADRMLRLREAGLLTWVDGERRTVRLTEGGRAHLSTVVWTSE